MSKPTTAGKRGVRAMVLATLVVLFGGLGAASSAQAEFGITSFSAATLNADGSPDTRAGGHPYVSQFEFSMNMIDDPAVASQPIPDGSLREVAVDLPKGFVGNTQAVPKCEAADAPKLRCSPATQVGVISLWATTTYGPFPVTTIPLFNMKPREGDVADFAFYNLGIVFHLRSRLLSDGYTVRTEMTNISQGVRVVGARVVLWGDPANPVHDVQRGSNFHCPFEADDPICLDPANVPFTEGGFSAQIPSRPFMTNPTDCAAVRPFRIRARSWQDPDRWVTATDELPAPAGCDALAFDPSIDAVFDTGRADSSTGLTFGMRVPQSDAVGGRATPSLKAARVTLPEGVSLNPSAAAGLTGCTDGQIGLGTDSPIGCASSAKVGEARIVSPLLDVALEGPIYLGQPVPGKPYRVFLVAESARYGVSIRLEGLLRPDPVTGRITAVFDNNPQLPFSDLELRFTGGPRGPLSTPLSCGVGTTTSELTPWAGADVLAATPSSPFAFGGGGCAGPGFAPSLRAGASSPDAGAATALSVTVGREDGERYLDGIDVSMPEGLLGHVGKVPVCPDAQAAAGTCGAQSQIGTTTTGAGTGPTPFYLDGRVYLTGPYKGAPYGLSVVVPALAGPYDLGTVVVRAAIHVDPKTAAVTVDADPLPRILEGIPLRLRKINVTVDRPGFMRNPTSCASKQIAASISAQDASTVTKANRFQVGDCTALSFTPKLTLGFTGRKQTTTGKHPGLRAKVRPGNGAAIRKAVVQLPKSIALDPDNAQALCEHADGTKPDLENHCPKGSIVGRAKATSPLLAKPLAGNVYFVKNVRRDPRTGNEIRTLPMIVVALRGDIAINLTGQSSTTKTGRLVNTFQTTPDAPVTHFNININGGNNGILAVTRTANTKLNLCTTTQTANATINGHNNKTTTFATNINTPCAKKATKTKKKRKR